MRALPFGSVRSVHAFLRVAHSLWAIATSEFLAPWTSYFDDFVTFSDSNEQVSVDVETPFEKRIVTLIYKRKFSKVPFEKADAPLRKSFSESLF